MRSACIFCSIDLATSFIVGESETALALLDINPATPGHTLVMPKKHAEDIWAISSRDFMGVADLARSTAALIDERLHPDGLTLFQANRQAGWQDVFHLHLHVVPRYVDDGLIRPWESTAAGRDELPAVHRALTEEHD